MERLLLVVLLLVLGFSCTPEATDVSNTRITSITPRYGSLNGETRLTIYGQNFARDQFSFGEGRSELGNKVTLVSDTKSFDCDIHKDGTHETQIMCYTQRMPHDNYYVRISVDGRTVPAENHCRTLFDHRCRFTAHPHWTPNVDSLSPSDTFPGSIIQINGRIMTTRYGSNQAESTNGRTEKILRVYVGDQKCELRRDDGIDEPDIDDELYGIALDKDGKANTGYMKCKLGGTFIGNSNVTFILEGALGRSGASASAYRVTAKDKITMFQSFAEVYNVTPSTGSVEGGTRLTVSGRFFYDPAEVRVGNTTCRVVDVQDNQIICETEPKPTGSSTDGKYDGNRGITWEYWGSDSIYKTADFESHINLTAPESTVHLDRFTWRDTNSSWNRFIFRMGGYFIPPRDSDYRFYLKSDDGSSLYLSRTGSANDLELIASAPRVASGSYKESQISEKIFLEGQKPYPIYQIVKEIGGYASGNIAVHMSRTNLPGGRVASSVHSEQQTIFTTSTVKTEIQSIKLENWASTSKTKEIQRVVVTSDNLDYVNFRLGMNGVFTAPLSGTSSASTVKTELNALPSIAPDTVSVSTSSVSGGVAYDVTFNSDLGDMAMLSALLDSTNQANATIEVTETTKGRSSMQKFALKFGNSTTAPISKSASNSQIQQAITDLFSVRCPGFLSSPPARKALRMDYETSTDFWLSGTRVSDTEPFCGSTSLKNPVWLYREHTGDNANKNPVINLLSTGQVCFAYKGHLQQKIYVSYYYKLADFAPGEDYRSVGDTLTNQIVIPQADDWSYVCLDVKTGIQDKHPTWQMRDARLARLQVYKDTTSSSADYFVDELLIVSANPTTDVQGVGSYRRLRPPMWIAEQVSVTDGPDDSFQVEITVRGCAHDLPLFSLLGAEVQEEQGNENVTYNSATWPNAATVFVSRLQAATPPIGGTFDLVFDQTNTLTGVPAGITAEDLALDLQTLPGMGIVSVARTGSCAGYQWAVTWSTAPGDQPLLVMDDSSLTGVNVSSGVTTIQDGGVFFDPIPGDLLRTIHETEQVRVDIDGITSQCSGSCDFEWSEAATPSLTSGTPSTGSNTDGTTITLTGSGFSDTNSENRVVIGGEACIVSSASANQIQCAVGRGPAGTHEVMVYVHHKGLARHSSGAVQFTYQFTVTAINPASGSLAGGTLLAITGTGFSPNATVTVGGDACPVVSATYSSITCRTPAKTAGSVDVVVTDGASTATSSTQFTYDTALTATVSSIDKNTVSVQGGETLTITGTGFGGSASGDDAVTLNGQRAVVSSYGDTQIEVTLPALPPGAYPLRILVGNAGFADITTNNIADISYDLSITNIFPTSGSKEGGSTLTVTGTGFPDNTSLVQVTVGNKPCEVETATATKVTCKTPSSGTVHRVGNTGVHPVNGEKYAWEPLNLQVQVGDTVQWTWAAPDRVTGINYKVQQTDSATSTADMADGFSSGTATPQGLYRYQFATAGTYYYWSGFVDGATIALRGTVTVVDGSATTEVVDLQVNGFSALHSTSSGVANPSDTSLCPGTNTAITGCTETAAPAGADAGRFYFNYLKCKTPTVTQMLPTEGSAADTITIDGTGFSTTDCQNEVKMGSETCQITSSTATQLQCRLSPSNDALVGVPQPLSVVVNNIGGALITVRQDLKRHFVLKPHVSNVSPNAGSTRGGTALTVTGGGFVNGSTVSIGAAGTACQVTSLSYDRIECTTDAAGVSSGDTLKVVARNPSGQAVDSLCADAANSCAYSFTTAMTPTVSGVTPTTVSADGTELTISGTGFGSSDGAVRVTLGGADCLVLTVGDTQITCNATGIPVGTHPVQVSVDPKGAADATGKTVTVAPSIDGVVPASGSTAGGTLLAISGVGFKTGATSVTVGDIDCAVRTVNALQVTCVTSAKAAGATKVAVLSNAVTYPLADFTYSAADTPEITSVSPSSGSSGDTLTLTGTGFSSDDADMAVTIDEVPCAVTASTTTQITCTLGAHSAGRYPVKVDHATKGFAAGTTEFTYALTVNTVSPTQGSYGGGQTIALSGAGFDSSTNVTVCGNPCQVSGTPTATDLTCITPAKTPGGATTACDVVVTIANVEVVKSSAFTYSSSLTPTISDVTPRRGGTGGGTLITIAGTGFGSDQGQVTITLAGTACQITELTDTQAICRTGSHRPSVKTKIHMSIGTNGIATQDNADFEYIDVWSSQFTWNNNPRPEAGDFVVIPADMTVLLDVDTPVLKILLINGGKLIFDEADVELQAENILITNGGTLQVGTEASPFQHKAIITLHGHPRSQELPVYGTKTIAVREGQLHLHGKAPNVVWTVLQATANAGDTQITLKDAVTWEVGAFIAIAPTGGRHSQSEHEMRQITAVSNDGRTLTLHSPLEFKHLGETVDLGSGYSLEARAEIGLLTRNVLVRGSNNSQWADTIPACPEGFNTGEFATQTCFQGRFGEEVGTDQYGAQIMMHAPRPNEGLVTGQIENIEMTYAGQAFRLGRYAIHFHLNGDMNGNYVRGCAIHHSFNRAVNIHGTHNVMIDNNVVYNIMGGAVFLEDGIETGNTFQYNLAIFVKSSTSLQNDDITPAAYWLTNANNTVQHNVAAGGTHFGFWYRQHRHPDGPSFDPNICPQNVPLGIFQNNTVHSHGWFGIWIFQEFYPMEDGACSYENPIAAKFDSLTAYNCEKGAEWVSVGAVQFHNFFMVNNLLAGIEMKLMGNAKSYSEERGPMLKGCVIVAKPATSTALVTSTKKAKTGVIVPYGRGLLMKDMTFVNFDGSDSAFGVTKVDGTSTDQNGGFTYKVSGLTFLNSPNKIGWRWLHEGAYLDMDGSLTGTAGATAVTTSGILPDKNCTHNVVGMSNGKVPGSVCQPGVKFVRWSFNKPLPDSLEFKNVSFTNEHGSTVAEFRDKRITHKDGWMVLLVAAKNYYMEFVDGGHLTNITYQGTFYDLGPNDYVIMSHDLTQSPDRFQVLANSESQNGTSSMVTYGANDNGDYYFDTATTTMSYLVSGRSSRKKRAAIPGPETGTVDRHIHFKVFRCQYTDCGLPLDPSMEAPPEERPAHAVLWTNTSVWRDADPGFGGNYGDGTFGLPRDGDDVMIKDGRWVVVDGPLPVMGKLYIYGVLEFEWQPDPSSGQVRNYLLSCTHIIINGGRLILGWENHRYTGNAQIILRGDHNTPDIPLSNGPNMGAKSIGVFGGLDLHGTERAVSWTRLSSTASRGTQSLALREPVDWVVGDEVVIAPTGYSAWETETKKITAVSPDRRTLTLNGTLQFNHLVTSETVGARTIEMAAEVGLLTRNIKVIGASYDRLLQEAFGARVLVGRYSYGGNNYHGYARISNVEFYHSGQEGWTEEYDPRFSVAFLDIGEVTDARPSYVRKCAFHHGFSPAIGTFATHSINITDNVIYHTVGASIQDSGIDNKFRNNLVTLMVNPSTFNGRSEDRIYWEAGLDVHRAVRPVLTGNVVAGSERAGYQVDGESCDDASGIEAWSNNVAHSALIGVEAIPPDDGLTGCSQIRGFTVYKAWDFGIYFQVGSSVIVSDVVSVDNTIGIFPMVLGPSAKNHQFAAKFVTIKNSVILGPSSTFDCTNDRLTNADRNVAESTQGRAFKTPSGGMIGITGTIFSQSTNNAPKKPWTNIMAYNSIGGLTYIHDTIFANFKAKCTNRRDVAIASSKNSDDAQHPIRTRAIQLLNVDTESKFFIFRPNIGRINPADCVDMDCDGQKKAILDDQDGSFLGNRPGTLLSQSEWEWDGDRRRGLGDYRIPKTLLTDLDGNRIPVNTIAPHKGIIRNDQCVLHADYQAWECHDLDYEMLILESLDDDTETRRLSPVALLGDGYIDLINGPQDHGWCFGYTCQKRLSTFSLVLAMGKYYTLHYTGTSPQNSRLRLLNADNTQAFVVGIHYFIPQRLDVYVDGLYVPPLNAALDGNGEQILRKPSTPDEYMPRVASDLTGSNYFNKTSNDNTLHVLVRGSTPVDIMTSPLIIVTFNLPAMTVEDFYGVNLVNNLARFLGIPDEKIKVATAAPETRRRRRRSTPGFKVELEISNPPSNQTNTTIPDPDTLSFDKLQNMTATIINSVQLGTLSNVLNVTILGFDITEPVPAPSSSAWRTVTVAAESGESYNINIQIPRTLVIETEPVAQSEGNAFGVQPVLRMLDQNGDYVNQLGSKMTPWQVTATLVKINTSWPQASLVGEATIDTSQGWANFTNLAIDYNGRYRLDFRISSPAEAESLFSASSVEFDVAERSLDATATTQSNVTYVGQNFSMEVVVVDAETKAAVGNVGWKGHSWTCVVSLYMPDLYPGSHQLQGTTQAPIDASTGRLLLDELRLPARGRYFLQAAVTSTPAAFNLLGVSGFIDVYPEGWEEPVIEVTKIVKISFSVDYNSTLADGRAPYFAAAVQNRIYTSVTTVNVSVGDVTLTEGSIIASVPLEGSSSGVDATIQALFDVVASSSFGFNFFGTQLVADTTMYVDDTPLIRTAVVPTALSTAVIVVIVIACVVAVVILVVLIVLLKMYIKKKNKTGSLDIDQPPYEPAAYPGGVPVPAPAGYRTPTVGEHLVARSMDATTEGPTEGQAEAGGNRRVSMEAEFQEFDLARRKSTRPIPLSEQPDDDDDDDEADGNVRADSARSGSGSESMTSPRSTGRSSRPPSKPSMVWDNDFSGPTSQTSDPFKQPPLLKEQGEAPVRKGAIGGKLPSIGHNLAERFNMYKPLQKKRLKKKRHSVRTIDSATLSEGEGTTVKESMVEREDEHAGDPDQKTQ